MLSERLSVLYVFLFVQFVGRYHEENCNMAFGEFRFGPLFMRLCYELGLEELAATTLMDPVL